MIEKEDMDKENEMDGYWLCDRGEPLPDEQLQEKFSQLFTKLRRHAVHGAKYFQDARGVSNRRFYSAYKQLLCHLVGGIESGVDMLLDVAPLFDYDILTRGNGYRSIVTVVERCCGKILFICRYIRAHRESYLFRSSHYSSELDAYVTTLGQLRACLYYMRKLLSYCPDGELFAHETYLSAQQYSVAERLMTEVEALSQESFYGRCLGFQYCKSMAGPLTAINIAMASYGEGYNSSASWRTVRLVTSVMSSVKYVSSPELRAKQVVNMTRDSDIHFCKAFWALGENIVMHKLPLCLCPYVAVDRVIVIQPDPLEMPLHNKSESTIVQPPSDPNPYPIHTRLISYVYRVGQSDAAGVLLNKVHPPSPGLLIHCHGGGFVAQSSASHEVYLRRWSCDLDIPILSVDYTLAPERQFPSQLEEIFFAYCWALNNASLLGPTAERVCIAGDSAGGNLALAVAMMASERGVRPPDGVLSAYGSLVVKYTPSPSRILALMDPLIPLGAVSMCLGAYAGLNAQDSTDHTPPSSALGDPAPD